MATEDNEIFTPEEQAIIQAELQKGMMGLPDEQVKDNVIAFFTKILRAKDTSKVSNLDNNELAAVRTLKELARYCEYLDYDLVSKYVNARSEDILATADSKQGFLAKLAVTSNKSYGIRKGMSRKKGGWFGKKDKEESADDDE